MSGQSSSLVARCNHCARQSLVKEEVCRRRVTHGNLLCDPAGESPDRPRLATSRNRVLRGPGVTPATKRTQGVCRPRDGAPKVMGAEPTLLVERKATTVAPSWPGAIDPPGSESGACRQGSPRNLGDLVRSTGGGGAGAAVEDVQAHRSCSAGGSEVERAVVPPSEGNEARRDGARGVGAH